MLSASTESDPNSCNKAKLVQQTCASIKCRWLKYVCAVLSNTTSESGRQCHGSRAYLRNTGFFPYHIILFSRMPRFLTLHDVPYVMSIVITLCINWQLSFAI